MTYYKVTRELFDRASGLVIGTTVRFVNNCDCEKCIVLRSREVDCTVCGVEFRKSNPSQHFKSLRHKTGLMHTGNCEYCPLTCKYRRGNTRLDAPPEGDVRHRDQELLNDVDDTGYAVCTSCGGLVQPQARGAGGEVLPEPNDELEAEHQQVDEEDAEAEAPAQEEEELAFAEFDD
jgi:hypothetical protein